MLEVTGRVHLSFWMGIVNFEICTKLSSNWEIRSAICGLKVGFQFWNLTWEAEIFILKFFTKLSFQYIMFVMKMSLQIWNLCYESQVSVQKSLLWNWPIAFDVILTCSRSNYFHDQAMVASCLKTYSQRCCSFLCQNS